MNRTRTAAFMGAALAIACAGPAFADAAFAAGKMLGNVIFIGAAIAGVVYLVNRGKKKSSN